MLSWKRSSCALLSSLLSLGFVAGATEKTWTLYHAWKGHEFSKRGQVRVAVAAEGGGVEATVDNADGAIDGNSLGDLYQLKLVDDSDSSLYTLTSVPACQVRRANFRDEFTLTLSSQASVVSLSYVPLVSPLAPSCAELMDGDSSSEATFTSKISVETSTPGMSLPVVLPSGGKPPAGLKFLKRPGGGQNTALPPPEQEQIGGPLGLLKRYWYLILPLAIMILSGGPEEPEQQQQQGGSPEGAAAGSTATHPSGGGGGAPRQATPAASAGGGSTQVRRRGKRG